MCTSNVQNKVGTMNMYYVVKSRNETTCWLLTPVSNKKKIIIKKNLNTISFAAIQNKTLFGHEKLPI